MNSTWPGLSDLPGTAAVRGKPNRRGRAVPVGSSQPERPSLPLREQTRNPPLSFEASMNPGSDRDSESQPGPVFKFQVDPFYKYIEPVHNILSTLQVLIHCQPASESREVTEFKLPVCFCQFRHSGWHGASGD